MDHLRAKFLEEAVDLLAELEKSLLKLEHESTQTSNIEQVFRVMHTLKGSSGMFGFGRIEELTHHLESIYDLIRNNKAKVNTELLSVTLLAVDHLREILNDQNLLIERNKIRHDRLLKQIINFATELEAGHKTGVQENTHDSHVSSESKPKESGQTTFKITFKPLKEIFLNGTNPLYLIDELYQLGDCKVEVKTDGIPSFEEMDPKLCYVWWTIYLTTEQDINAIKDVFIFVEDDCELIITEINNELKPVKTEPVKVDPTSEENNKIGSDQGQMNTIRSLAQKVRSLSDNKPETTFTPSTEVKPAAKDSLLQSIRVASDKLDDLMNLVSELVTTQARLSLFAEQNEVPELQVIAENIEKISRRLRDNTFSICLIPLENMVTRFQRLVRDLSSELNKEIIFVTEGTETELDKSIIESLADPLMHIFRNSIDHGIESTEERIRKGKAAQGKIILKAYYSGTNVHIQIKDDGAGINTEKVKAKAISKGLISPEVNLSEKDILDLIFMPGFSTADKLSEVSGRGVGMDVVRRKISDIRGEVEINSEQDKGTTITIMLPLTLSIIDGLLINIASTHYVIPLSVVDKCFEVSYDQLVGSFNNLLLLDNEKVPFFYLRKEFNEISECPFIQQVVVVSYDNVKVGLTVDAIIGEYQAVLKPLGRLYKNQENISGATILGDGTIALVLDTNKIIKQFSTRKVNTSTYYE